MSSLEHEQPGIGGDRTRDRDEDQVSDDWYAAADEAFSRGAAKPLGFDPQDLEPIVVLYEELFGSDGKSDDDGESEVDSAYEDDEDEAFDDESKDLEMTPGSGRICDHCGGSGSESGGDGAQCQSCAGSG